MTQMRRVCPIGIGGMGQGKTKGLVSNFLIGAYLKGYGGLAIDPNKREIGDQIQCAVNAGIVKKEDFIRIDLGQQAFSLDWCETLHDSHQSNENACCPKSILIKSSFFTIPALTAHCI